MRKYISISRQLLLVSILLALLGCDDIGYDRIPEKVEGFDGPTLVFFHASWCGYCRLELPLVKELYRTYSPCGLSIAGVNEDDSEEAMKRYVAEEKIPFPVVFWDYPLMKKFGNPRAIPANFLLDSAGNVKLRKMGPLSEGEARAAIESVLGDRARNCRP